MTVVNETCWGCVVAQRSRAKGPARKWSYTRNLRGRRHAAYAAGQTVMDASKIHRQPMTVMFGNLIVQGAGEEDAHRRDHYGHRVGPGCASSSGVVEGDQAIACVSATGIGMPRSRSPCLRALLHDAGHRQRNGRARVRRMNRRRRASTSFQWPSPFRSRSSSVEASDAHADAATLTFPPSEVPASGSWFQ